jgi:ribonucleotide reductase alpha subunit
LADAVVESIVPGRKPAQRSIRALSPNGEICSRSSAGVFTITALRVISADVRAFTAAAQATIPSIDLDDAMAAAAKEARKTNAVTAGPLDPEHRDPTEPFRPGRERRMTVSVGADRELADASS